MVTNQVMESIDRDLCGVIIRQRTKDKFFCLGDVMKIINLDKIDRGQAPIIFRDFAKMEHIKLFINELEKEIGMPSYIRATKSSRGWLHPFLALKLLTHYNPKLEIQVYKWLMDYLIDNRISSSDSYNKMCGVLFKYATNKIRFPKAIRQLAKTIKNLIIGKDKEWNKASEDELKKRDELHNLIADLTASLGDCNQGVKLGIKVYKDKYLS